MRRVSSRAGTDRVLLGSVITLIILGASTWYYTAVLIPSRGNGGAAIGGVGLHDNTSVYSFGNIANGNTTYFTGWSMPANTLVSTSFVTTNSINGFLAVTFNVFPYQVSQNTTIYLGLYIDGQLRGSSTSNMSDSRARQATMLGRPTDAQGGQIANFTRALEGYSASILNIVNPVPAGVTVTLTAFVTSPIWVQVAAGGSHSIESPSNAPIPSTLPNDMISAKTTRLMVVPVTLCVGGETNAA